MKTLLAAVAAAVLLLAARTLFQAGDLGVGLRTRVDSATSPAKPDEPPRPGKPAPDADDPIVTSWNKRFPRSRMQDAAALDGKLRGDLFLSGKDDAAPATKPAGLDETIRQLWKGAGRDDVAAMSVNERFEILERVYPKDGIAAGPPDRFGLVTVAIRNAEGVEKQRLTDGKAALETLFPGLAENAEAQAEKLKGWREIVDAAAKFKAAEADTTDPAIEPDSWEGALTDAARKLALLEWKPESLRRLADDRLAMFTAEDATLANELQAWIGGDVRSVQSKSAEKHNALLHEHSLRQEAKAGSGHPRLAAAADLLRLLKAWWPGQP